MSMGVLIIMAIVLLVVVYMSNNKERTKEAARKAYADSLEELKRDPTNANLRQETLRLGRSYSNLTRNSKGVTVFDEVALSNDLNAACAAAAARNDGDINTPEDRLVKLGELRQKGLVTEE